MERAMTASEDRLRVFYDGACPSCVRDRKFYERLAGRTGDAVEWVDITGRDEELKMAGATFIGNWMPTFC
jgi:predicted DCC family thiol-disulfide oxidoreductase YuxK